MSRLAKQFLYGVFYLSVWAVILGGLYFLFLKPEPSCTNGVRDRGEEGIDCGGTCPALCLPQTLQGVEVSGSVQVFFPGTNTASLLAKLQNPNLELGARTFAYEFALYGTGGELLRAARGRSFIYPGEIKYLADFFEFPDARKIRRAELRVDSIDWVPASGFERPEFSLQERKTTSGESSVEVSGRLVNRDTFTFPRVTLTAILKSGLDRAIGVSQTELRELSPGESRAFTIIHPPLAALDASKTEVFVSAERP